MDEEKTFKLTFTAEPIAGTNIAYTVRMTPAAIPNVA